MKITSTAFEHEGNIPSKYTCDGENMIPPLTFSDVPKGTKSLALVVDDPDIPDSVRTAMGIEAFVHWIVFNFSPETQEVAEGKVPVPGEQGQNSSGKNEYTGPCPPDGEHRYFFRLYALDTELELPIGADREQLEELMAGHILEKAELIGLYRRS